MSFAPFLFKSKAMRALKGNWQTALLVTFFSTILTTVVNIVQTTRLPDVTTYAAEIAMAGDQTTYMALYHRMEAALLAVAPGTWVLYGVLTLLALLLSPMLELGCNHYFIRRLQGEELGFMGLFSRVRQGGKALLLSIIIAVKVFLWSLLLVVPGIIAAIRYSMAYFYMAENPELGAWEAVEKSKQSMQNTKMSYFLLSLSFIMWMLLSTMLQMMLGGISVVLALVAGQFINLFISTYMNGSFAAFFLTVSNPKVMQFAQSGDFTKWMAQGGEGTQEEEESSADNTDTQTNTPPEAFPSGNARGAETDSTDAGSPADTPAPGINPPDSSVSSSSQGGEASPEA